VHKEAEEYYLVLNILCVIQVVTVLCVKLQYGWNKCKW